MLAAMSTRLRPTAPFAADAILVGDPGRALLLAQELLEKPKMSNHARGLWGYSGRTADGDELSIQATGMGGPSAAMVLADLAELGVKRAVRVGTCAALEPVLRPGKLLLAGAALATPGSAAAFGVGPGEAALPDPRLLERLAGELGDNAETVTVARFDSLPPASAANAAAADMQTLAILARGGELGIAAAAVLIVSEAAEGERLTDEELKAVALRAGLAAASALSNPQVEGEI
jgi:uridine phosphorylase